MVRPFDLDRARIRLVRIGDDGYELTVPVRSATPRTEAVGELELALDPHGDLLAALRLHHAFAHHAVAASYRFPGTAQPERRGRLALAPRDDGHDGFANPLEQLRARIHFPLAALVVRVTIDHTPPLWQQLEITIRLAPTWPRELAVPPGALVLHAVPIINLHRELADPMALDGTTARLEVLHPEPVRGLRPRELIAVYRADRAGLTALAPEALAGAGADWYAAEVDGRHALRRLWLDVHAPGAFAARAHVVADVDWYDPDAARVVAGAVDARLTARHLDGVRWRVLSPIAAGADSPVAGRRDRLHRLLALAGRSDLDAAALAFLLDALGCADHPLFQRVTRAIARLDVTSEPDARAASGIRTTFALGLGELARALVPAAEVLLSRVPALITAWAGDAQPIVRVAIAVDGDDVTTTYRSEAVP